MADIELGNNVEGIELDNIKFDGDLLVIPFSNNGSNFLAKIAPRKTRSARKLMGLEFGEYEIEINFGDNGMGKHHRQSSAYLQMPEIISNENIPHFPALESEPAEKIFQELDKSIRALVFENNQQKLRDVLLVIAQGERIKHEETAEVRLFSVRTENKTKTIVNIHLMKNVILYLTSLFKFASGRLIRIVKDLYSGIFVKPVGSLPASYYTKRNVIDALVKLSRTYAIWTDNLSEKIEECKDSLQGVDKLYIDEVFQSVRNSVKAEKNEQWGVILAGGYGLRFWPVGNIDKPKQLLEFEKGTGTLLQQAVRRQINAPTISKQQLHDALELGAYRYVDDVWEDLIRGGYILSYGSLGVVQEKFWDLFKKAQDPADIQLGLKQENRNFDKKIVTLLSGTKTYDPNSIDPSHIVVVINRNIESEVREQLEIFNIPPENIVTEPELLNTGPAFRLGISIVESLAAREAERKKVNPLIAADNAIVRLLYADHVIPDGERFNRILGQCADMAKLSCTCLEIGVKPGVHVDVQLGHQVIGKSIMARTGSLPGETIQFLINRVDKDPSLSPDDYNDLVLQGALWNSGCLVARTGLLKHMMSELHPDVERKFRDFSRDLAQNPAAGNALLEALYKELSELDKGGKKTAALSVDYMFSVPATKKRYLTFDTACATGLKWEDWLDVGKLSVPRLVMIKKKELDETANYVVQGNSEDILFSERTKENTVYSTEDGTRIFIGPGVSNLLIAYEEKDDSLLVMPFDTCLSKSRNKEIPEDILSMEKLKHLLPHVKSIEKQDTPEVE
ncbi:MAG: hypothetical protein ABH883_04700, partial [Candidatus Omnitrophota bacterium]